MQVETLGKIRHRNIVKLLCCCSNNESNLLVYEYMPNGSLGDILHSTKGGTLDWAMRYRIALGAAQVQKNRTLVITVPLFCMYGVAVHRVLYHPVASEVKEKTQDADCV